MVAVGGRRSLPATIAPAVLPAAPPSNRPRAQGPSVLRTDSSEELIGAIGAFQQRMRQLNSAPGAKPYTPATRPDPSPSLAPSRPLPSPTVPPANGVHHPTSAAAPALLAGPATAAAPQSSGGAGGGRTSLAPAADGAAAP